MCSLSSLAVNTLTRTNKGKREELWAPLPFPTRPCNSSSYGFPLLPVIYHWCQGGCFLSSQLPLWSSARQLLDSRMAPELLSIPPKESSSFLLGPWSHWMMDLKGQTEWTSFLMPHQLREREEGKRSNPPMACEHAPLRISIQTGLGPESAICSILCQSSIFFSCSFHLWGPSSAPSDLTEHDCPLLPTTAPQWSQDREYIFSWVFSKPNRLIHPKQSSTVGKSIVLQSELYLKLCITIY